jgi:hypothetical protein
MSQHTPVSISKCVEFAILSDHSAMTESNSKSFNV